MFQIRFLADFVAFPSDVQKSYLESVLGSFFCACYGVTCGVYYNPTDKIASVAVLVMGKLVCQWWGETVRTYLKAAWNSRKKRLTSAHTQGSFTASHAVFVLIWLTSSSSIFNWIGIPSDRR